MAPEDVATDHELPDMLTLSGEAQELLAELDVQQRADGTDEPGIAAKLVTRPGPVDIGLLATTVDLVAGHVILRRGWPCGISTTEMTLNGVHRLQGPGELLVTTRVVSVSATRGCMELDLEVEGSGRGPAIGTAVFKLFRWDDLAHVPAPGPWKVGVPTRSLEEPLWRRAGIEVDAVAGVARVDLRPEIANHVDSLQGGVTSALLEAAATTRLDPDHEVRSVALTFLSQGRNGPFEATARRPGPDGDVVVSAAVDRGSDDRPLAHAVFTSAPRL